MKIKNQSHATVTEYEYNGLGHRIGHKWDTDGDTDLEWQWMLYDDKWRVIARFEDAGGVSSPFEQIYHHHAGVGGYGQASYIDSVICRDRIDNSGDSPVVTRDYVLQNWRADVIALANSSGNLLERVWYDPYGVPFATHPTDLTKGAIGSTVGYGMPDGVLNNDDYSYFLTLYGGTDWRADWNRDGSINATDNTVYLADKAAASGSWGRGVLSNKTNILGYAGYVHEPATGGAGAGQGTMWHCRMRVHHAGLGRWIQRDPPQYEYREGPSLYSYCDDKPIVLGDWIGAATCPGFSPAQTTQFQLRLGSIRAACPGVSINFHFSSSCASGNGGTTPSGSCSVDVKICTGAANPNAPSGTRDCNLQFDAIMHELTHVQQACSSYGLCSSTGFNRGAWNNEDNSICREVDAYCQESPRSCPGGVPSPNTVVQICNRSCDSVHPSSPSAWSICVARCTAIASMCAGGIYTPPPAPPGPPWWLIPIEILPHIPVGPLLPGRFPIGGGVGVV